MLILHKVERILLASESPRRREILASLGAEITVIPSTYVESTVPGLLPIELAMRHARGKMIGSLEWKPTDTLREEEERKKANGTIRVSADTVVDVDGATFGKPRNDLEARRMLLTLSGREHVVHTAFALVLPSEETPNIWKDSDAPPVEPIVKVQSTRVRFHSLTPTDIDEYVETGEPIDKAGGYGIQGLAAALVDTIDGDFYTVMGFPLGRFIRSMRDLGYIFR